MDIDNRREKMLKLQKELLAVEDDRLEGKRGCTLDELDAYLEDIRFEMSERTKRIFQPVLAYHLSGLWIYRWMRKSSWLLGKMANQ